MSLRSYKGYFAQTYVVLQKDNVIVVKFFFSCKETLQLFLFGKVGKMQWLSWLGSLARALPLRVV